jgi:hypothetical protein
MNTNSAFQVLAAGAEAFACALDQVPLAGPVSMGDPSHEPGGDVPRQWFTDEAGYAVWSSLFIVKRAGQQPQVHWPRALRWVFSRQFQPEDHQPFAAWYLAEAFRLKWDASTSAAVFKQWSHTGGFLADWVYGEIMSRGGTVHKKYRAIGNGTYAVLAKHSPGYIEEVAAGLNDESLGDCCEVAVALMWIRMDVTAIRSLVLAVLRVENVDLSRALRWPEL